MGLFGACSQPAWLYGIFKRRTFHNFTEFGKVSEGFSRAFGFCRLDLWGVSAAVACLVMISFFRLTLTPQVPYYIGY